MRNRIFSYLILMLLFACLPKPAKYPYKDPSLLILEARKYSDQLEAYVREGLKGSKPVAIPMSVLPPGIDTNDCKKFYFQPFDQIDPKTQWAIRRSEPIDFKGIRTGIPDPHVTYLLLGAGIAPFGSKVVIEGEFPYCRFFSIQISPPFDGKGYTANYAIGTCENSIADVDIEPLAGNENPFLPGANRLTKNRKYKVEFDLKYGDALQADPDFKPPYRGKKTKAGALIINQGPWAKKLSGKGEWNKGLIWIRMYAPDKNKDVMGGVPLPKVHFVLPTGEKYYINCDWSGMEKRANYANPAKPTAATEPKASAGPDKGWAKSFGILQSIGIGISQSTGRFDQKTINYINAADLGATGRGENQPDIHHYEPHATTNNYATYLGREMSLGKCKVIVLTGKMPTFPDTRYGSLKMDTAQVRYWSIGTYDYNPFGKTAGGVLTSLMDDEVILDKERRYIIMYSRKEDRPINATLENGIVWVEWGPISTLGFLIRWVSVAPEWSCPFNPHEENLPWSIASQVGSRYNPKLLNTNDQKGFMGEYLPQVHYMTKADFEALGTIESAKNIPAWNTLHGNGK